MLAFYLKTQIGDAAKKFLQHLHLVRREFAPLTSKKGLCPSNFAHQRSIEIEGDNCLERSGQEFSRKFGRHVALLDLVLTVFGLVVTNLGLRVK